MRDAFGDLAALAWSQVTCEPIVREACTSSKTTALVADFSVRGVWFHKLRRCLIDIRVVDTEAQHTRIVHQLIFCQQLRERRRQSTTGMC